MQVYAAVRAQALEEVPDLVRRVEALGFDGIHFAELKLDPFLATVLAAEHTAQLEIGTSIALAFPRSPMITASIAWALQRFSRGRFRLGLGTQVKGHNERRFSVPWIAPAARLREYVLSLRAIWTCWQRGTPLDFQGKFYSFTLMTPEFNPGPIDHPDVPVLISAVNPHNLRLAAEVCDGVLLHPLCSRAYVDEVVLPNLDAGARAAGRSLGDVEIGGGGFVITGPDEAALASQIEVARQRIAFYASTGTYKPVMDVHGWGGVAVQLRQLSLKGRWQEMARLVTDEMVEAFSVVGTYDRIAERIARRHGGWASHVDLPFDDVDAEGAAGLRQAIRAAQAVS